MSTCSCAHDDLWYSPTCRCCTGRPHAFGAPASTPKPATVCVRLDGLADKIAAALYADVGCGGNDSGRYPSWADQDQSVRDWWIHYGEIAASLLQSLAVQ